MDGPKGINWESALEFYLTPDPEGRIPSYQDVADKFGVSKSEVGLRAKNENWLQRRRNLYDLAEETFVENRVELINQTIARHIKTWRTIQDLASNLLNKLDQSFTENGYRSWDVKELTFLAGILKTAIEGERTALGLPNTVSSANIQVPKQEVTLPPELIQEIDRLFEINSRPALVN
ncbi:MAG: hypothetical protein HYW86_00680 [Candidatus Roizmanbacteria bacterium]|nr:MAG: hypothetical protein HYW86_00680 [Candidatus Roizmanbacteria bacterium]